MGLLQGGSSRVYGAICVCDELIAERIERSPITSLL